MSPTLSSCLFDEKWPGPREDPGGLGGLDSEALSSWTGPKGNGVYHKVFWGAPLTELGRNRELCFALLQSVRGSRRLNFRVSAVIMTLPLQEARLSETEPIVVPLAFRAGGLQSPSEGGARRDGISFDRRELSQILNVYGRKVASGEWRDYAIDTLKEKAVFSVFRRSSEMPLYRIEKTPRLARRQGAYTVIAATGLILKRGHDLARVLRALDKGLRLVEA